MKNHSNNTVFILVYSVGWFAVANTPSDVRQGRCQTRENHVEDNYCVTQQIISEVVVFKIPNVEQIVAT